MEFGFESFTTFDLGCVATVTRNCNTKYSKLILHLGCPKSQKGDFALKELQELDYVKQQDIYAPYSSTLCNEQVKIDFTLYNAKPQIIFQAQANFSTNRWVGRGEIPKLVFQFVFKTSSMYL